MMTIPAILMTSARLAIFPHPKIHPPQERFTAFRHAGDFDASSLGSPMCSTTMAAWHCSRYRSLAKPRFDDSKWPTADAKEALAEVQ